MPPHCLMSGGGFRFELQVFEKIDARLQFHCNLAIALAALSFTKMPNVVALVMTDHPGVCVDVCSTCGMRATRVRLEKLDSMRAHGVLASLHALHIGQDKEECERTRAIMQPRAPHVVLPTAYPPHRDRRQRQDCTIGVCKRGEEGVLPLASTFCRLHIFYTSARRLTPRTTAPYHGPSTLLYRGYPFTRSPVFW